MTAIRDDEADLTEVDAQPLIHAALNFAVLLVKNVQDRRPDLAGESVIAEIRQALDEA